MKTFNAYKHPTQGVEVVKVGFSWPALFFGIIWMLVKKLWTLAALWFGALFLCAFIHAAVDNAQKGGGQASILLVLTAAYFALWLIPGFKGNKWREKSLSKRGYELLKNAQAETFDARTCKSVVPAYESRKEENIASAKGQPEANATSLISAEPVEETFMAHEIQDKSISTLGEFPYQAELQRRVYAHLLKEQKDEATELQAMVQSDGDAEKAKVLYYKLRYRQILESGEIERFKKEILAEKGPDEVGRDGVFIAYVNDIVKDTKTELEWVAGPDKDMTWDKAKAWVEGLKVEGGGWRMPTINELETLYQKGKGTRNMTPLLKTSGWWVWSGEEGKDSLGAPLKDFLGTPLFRIFHLSNGANVETLANNSSASRAFAVRSKSDG